MNRQPTTLERLARQNPVGDDASLAGPPEVLARIIEQPRSADIDSARRHLTPRLLTTAAAAAVVVALSAAAVVHLSGFTSPSEQQASPEPRSSFVLPATEAGSFTLTPGDGTDAATPTPLRFAAFESPIGAGDLLGALAGTAEREPIRGSGPIDYRSTREWNRQSNQTEDGTVFASSIIESSRQIWLAPNGSGRLDRSEGGGQTESLELTPTQPEAPPVDVTPESTPQTLRDELVASQPNRPAVDWMRAYTDAWSNQVLSPALQSAYLLVLADQADVEVVGTVTDRAGRTGVAVSAADSSVRVVLIFDVGTGRLLDHERIALTPEAVDGPSDLPTTVGYVVSVDEGLVNNVGEVPAR